LHDAFGFGDNGVGFAEGAVVDGTVYGRAVGIA
jgi:hypothetical protein